MTRFTTLAAVFLFAIAGWAIASAAMPEGWEKTRDLSHVHAVVVTGEGFHDGEAMIPMAFLRQRGASVTIVGPEHGTVTAYNSNHTLEIQKTPAEVSVEDFDLMILPGGRAPGLIRQDEAVVEFARAFFETGKPVAAICHGPQVLVTAGVLAGRTATCVSRVGAEIEEAGGQYVNQSVVIDGNLITSRLPGDIPEFCIAIAMAVAAPDGEE